MVADVKQKVARKAGHQTTAFAPAEREQRILGQRIRLSGLRLRGEEEVVGHQCLSVAHGDSLVHSGPERFIARRLELQHRKPSRELTIDASSLVVKDKP